jgi:hypothetical protein
VNENIRQYFDVVEVRLIESQVVASYQVISRDISVGEGKIRIKSILSNGDTFEFFVYMTESNQKVVLEKYSFHWQDKNGGLLIRMDNAPHYPKGGCKEANSIMNKNGQRQNLFEWRFFMVAMTPMSAATPPARNRHSPRPILFMTAGHSRRGQIFELA